MKYGTALRWKPTKWFSNIWSSTKCKWSYVCTLIHTYLHINIHTHIGTCITHTYTMYLHTDACISMYIHTNYKMYTVQKLLQHFHL